jgi:predicted Zn-dependent protease
VQQNDPSAERVLREALAIEPSAAAAHHALGLTLIRQRRANEALAELERATALDPSISRYAYVYAVALHDSGKPREAIAILERGSARHPADSEIAAAMSAYKEEDQARGRGTAK